MLRPLLLMLFLLAPSAQASPIAFWRFEGSYPVVPPDLPSLEDRDLFVQLALPPFGSGDRVRLFEPLLLGPEDIGARFSSMPATDPGFERAVELLMSGNPDLRITGGVLVPEVPLESSAFPSETDFSPGTGIDREILAFALELETLESELVACSTDACDFFHRVRWGMRFTAVPEPEPVLLVGVLGLSWATARRTRCRSRALPAGNRSAVSGVPGGWTLSKGGMS